MADVTTTFAAKDVGFASTVNRMQKTLAGFQSNLGSFATKLAGLAAAFVGVQQSVASFNNALAMGGRLDDLSKTTGASAGELLLLEKAFQLAGSSAEAVGPVIARLNRFMVEANSGGAAQVETMNKLGLSYAQLEGRTPTEQMRLLAQSIMALPTPAERTAAAMDIFGRSGSTLIPLFANFSGELDKAQGYLGSLPGLLDQSAGAMADMEDDLAALGDKFNQFVAGLVAGAAGADNFASALAKIDTAGIGANLGEQLRVAFDAPKEAAAAVGHTLLTGVKEAGNWLMAAINKAGDTYYAMLQNPGFYAGLQRFLEGMFAQVGEVFVSSIIDGLKAAFGLMDWNPLWKPLLDVAKGQMSKIQEDIKIAGEAAANTMEQGATQMKAAFNNAASDSKLIYQDIFGAREQAEKAAESWMQAQESSRQIREDSAQTAANYGEGSAAIRNALNDIRGFDLKGQMGPDARPDWTKSNKPPPDNASARLAAEEEAARNRNAPRGGGSRTQREFDPATDYGRALRERGSQSTRYDPASSRLSSTGLAIERTKERFSVDKMASDIRSDLSRLNRKLKPMEDRANRFEDQGMFGSAERLRGRADRLRAEREKRLADQYGLDLSDQAKTPEERAREEAAARDKYSPKGGGQEGPSSLESLVRSIKAFCSSIDSKLPQHAMT